MQPRITRLDDSIRFDHEVRFLVLSAALGGEREKRDNRLNPIHEGTNGVQALDLLGRKVRQDNGAGFHALLAQMRMVADQSATHPDVAPLGAQLAEAVERLARVTATLLAAGGDPARALANATAYLDLVSRTVVAWLWLRQALAAARGLATATPAAERNFYSGKVQSARYWFGWELPRTEQLAALLERADATPFEMQDAWF